MEGTIESIPLARLAIVFVPVLVVLWIFAKWSVGVGSGLHALGRMLLQLLLVGYFLIYVFEAGSSWVVLAVLAVMLLASSWIALRTVGSRRRELYRHGLLAIALGGVPTLLVVTQGVLGLQPWYLPQFMVPLAGMIFANAMTSVSLAAERLYAEMDRGESYEVARRIAFRAALIPIMNMLFAVGLVSLPGMMTGQILSGVSPLIAVRYQIVVMCMVFASAGISAAAFLVLIRGRVSGANA